MSLGDIVATYYVLENIGRTTGQIYSVCGDEISKEIFSCFNLSYIKPIRKNGIRIIDFLTDEFGSQCCPYEWRHQGFLQGHHYITLLNRLSQIFQPNYQALTSPLNPVEKHEMLVQFDGRTASRQKRDISITKKKSFIDSISTNWTCIGGKDTPNYFGTKVNYLKGNISFIVQHLLGCQLFVGSDSGLSHIVGSLGIPSKIMILGSCYSCLCKYYRNYLNIETISNFTKMI